MILSLTKFLTHDDSALMEAANQLKGLSDEEFFELAYILRKIIRESDYNTVSNEVMIRGYNLIYSDDYEIFVTLSKLISKQPYESVNEVADKFKEVFR